MPRTARVVDPEGCYHITCRGNNRAVIFHDDDDFEVYRAIVEYCKRKLPFELFHYVLMDNHVHFLIRLIASVPMARIMKMINQGYSLHYKRRYDHIGRLWQDRYHSRHVDNDAYWLACGAYIELNPVRARMVRRADDYRWSSARQYLFGIPDVLVDTDPAFLAAANDDAGRRVEHRLLLTLQRDLKWSDPTMPDLAKK